MVEATNPSGISSIPTSRPCRAASSKASASRQASACCRATFGLDFDGRAAAALAPMVRRVAAKRAPASYQRLKELLERAE